MKYATTLAVIASAISWYSWQKYHLRMIPDFHLYTQGGLGLYPSPIGRLLGFFGETPFAAISSLSSGIVVWLTYSLANKHKCNPALAATLAITTPAFLYLTYAGIDPIGLALLLAYLNWYTPKLLILAALTHFSLAPFLVFLLRCTNWPTRIALILTGQIFLVALLLTPYSGIIYGIFSTDLFHAIALAAVALASLSVLPLLFGGYTRTYTVAALIGLLEVAAQHHLQVRYLLPAIFIATAHTHWSNSPMQRFTTLLTPTPGGSTNSRLSPDNWTVKSER